ncbi:hypothetical protein CRV24_006807 [Beauveria bassiana]|nr:hypothetical protein CRV24_006807 [Beauveria bassiana]
MPSPSPARERFLGTNRGTAYILYDHEADAEAAIANMHEAQVDGAIIHVSIVLPRRKLSPPPPTARRGANIDPACRSRAGAEGAAVDVAEAVRQCLLLEEQEVAVVADTDHVQMSTVLAAARRVRSRRRLLGAAAAAAAVEADTGVAREPLMRRGHGRRGPEKATVVGVAMADEVAVSTAAMIAAKAATEA